MVEQFGDHLQDAQVAGRMNEGDQSQQRDHMFFARLAGIGVEQVLAHVLAQPCGHRLGNGIAVQIRALEGLCHAQRHLLAQATGPHPRVVEALHNLWRLPVIEQVQRPVIAGAGHRDQSSLPVV